MENNTELVTLEITAQNGKQEVVNLYDQTLIAHTQTIQKYRDAGNLTILGIAQEMREIDEDQSYAKAGFKSVAEYANVCFDYKRQTVSLYVKAATYFLTKDADGKLALADATLPWFSMGQMIELLPLCDTEGIEGVKNALVSGEINPRMSTKKLRTAVKSLTAIEGEVTKVEDSSETTGTGNTDNTTDAPINPEEVIASILRMMSELQEMIPADKSEPLVRAMSAMGEIEI